MRGERGARLASLWLFAAALSAAACGGGSTQPAQPAPGVGIVLTAATCPPPSPGPAPYPPVLIYPIPGATAVPVDAGEIVFVGSFDSTYGPGTYTLTSSSATPVPLGFPTTAPSPLPSPAATLPPDSPFGYMSWPYAAVPMPTLSPATTYAFGYNATGSDPNNPPACTQQYSQQVGTFTTK